MTSSLNCKTIGVAWRLIAQRPAQRHESKLCKALHLRGSREAFKSLRLRTEDFQKSFAIERILLSVFDLVLRTL